MENNYIDRLELRCKNCGATMSIDSDKKVARCSYCNSEEILIESEKVTIAKIELAQQEKEIVKLKLHSEKNQEEQLNKIRKSFLTILMLIFMVIAAIVAAVGFTDSYIVSGAIALAQAALFFSAWMIRMRFIKGAKRRIHTLVMIVALLGIIPFLLCMEIQYRSYTKYIWPGSGLSELIPPPVSQLGEVRSDNDTTFSMMIGKTRIEEFDAYVEECKQRGFTYDQNRYNDSYVAYNDDGTRIRLMYIERTKEFHIDIEALPEMKEYYWNTKGIAGMLPKPKSTLGFIKNESTKSYTILVAQVNKEAYVDYIAECTDAGFNINVSDYNEHFSAQNSDGYRLSVNRDRNDIMEIFIYLGD